MMQPPRHATRHRTATWRGWVAEGWQAVDNFVRGAGYLEKA